MRLAADLERAAPLLFVEVGPRRVVFKGRVWPSRGQFSREALTQLEPWILQHGLMIDVHVSNGRAIYRMVELDGRTGIAVGDLVYHEGPE